MESWQKCPVCEGHGDVIGQAIRIPVPCTVCDGQKIIHRISGLPPSKHSTRAERLRGVFKEDQTPETLSCVSEDTEFEGELYEERRRQREREITERQTQPPPPPIPPKIPITP